MMFSTLNRYIAKRVVKGLLLAFLVVTSVIMLVDFVEGTRNIGSEEDIGSGTVFLLTLLKAPQLIEQTIPFVVLFGVMGTLYSLNRRSELIVLRASGLSAWRFLAPAICVTATIGLIWAMAFNPLASYAMNTHDKLVERITGSAVSVSENSIWLREGNDIAQTVIYAERADILERKLFNTTFYISELLKTERLYLNADLTLKKPNMCKVTGNSAMLLKMQKARLPSFKMPSLYPQIYPRRTSGIRRISSPFLLFGRFPKLYAKQNVQGFPLLACVCNSTSF
jgi:lipopolysaccharide export LptBFGC system permease protein LptF